MFISTQNVVDGYHVTDLDILLSTYFHVCLIFFKFLTFGHKVYLNAFNSFP